MLNLEATKEWGFLLCVSMNKIFKVFLILGFLGFQQSCVGESRITELNARKASLQEELSRLYRFKNEIVDKINIQTEQRAHEIQLKIAELDGHLIRQEKAASTIQRAWGNSRRKKPVASNHYSESNYSRVDLYGNRLPAAESLEPGRLPRTQSFTSMNDYPFYDASEFKERQQRMLDERAQEEVDNEFVEEINMLRRELDNPYTPEDRKKQIRSKLEYEKSMAVGLGDAYRRAFGSDALSDSGG